MDKKTIAALSAGILIGTTSITAVHAENHSTNQTKTPQQQVKDGKCGTGKCGSDKTAKDGKCGTGKCGSDKTAKDGKCGTGKCGKDKDTTTSS